MHLCLRRKDVSERLVRLVPEKYIRARTSTGVQSREFGLHHGSSLRPQLFFFTLDILNEHLRREGMWELLFADRLPVLAVKANEKKKKTIRPRKEIPHNTYLLNIIPSVPA